MFIQMKYLQQIQKKIVKEKSPTSIINQKKAFFYTAV